MSQLKDTIINNKFQLLGLIGEGSYGQVYFTKNITSNTYAATKTESFSSDCQSIAHEAYVHKQLNGPCFSKIYGYGQIFKSQFSYIISELLSLTLEDLFEYCGRKFTLKTTCMLFDQILASVECMHNQDFMHRDIKPDNFLLGLGPQKSSQVYIIDFGLAKRFRKKRKQHIPFKENKDLTGTVNFLSCNAHKRYELSRRDDLESVGYMMIYFLKGSLPWSHQPNKITFEERVKQVADIKFNISMHDLCKDCPPQIEEYMTYVKQLGFDEEPQYDYMRDLVSKIANTFNFSLTDKVFDWCVYHELIGRHEQPIRRQIIDKNQIQFILNSQQAQIANSFYFEDFTQVMQLMKTINQKHQAKKFQQQELDPYNDIIDDYQQIEQQEQVIECPLRNPLQNSFEEKNESKPQIKNRFNSKLKYRQSQELNVKEILNLPSQQSNLIEQSRNKDNQSFLCKILKSTKEEQSSSKPVEQIQEPRKSHCRLYQSQVSLDSQQSIQQQFISFSSDENHPRFRLSLMNSEKSIKSYPSFDSMDNLSVCSEDYQVQIKDKQLQNHIPLEPKANQSLLKSAQRLKHNLDVKQDQISSEINLDQSLINLDEQYSLKDSNNIGDSKEFKLMQVSESHDQSQSQSRSDSQIAQFKNSSKMNTNSSENSSCCSISYKSVLSQELEDQFSEREDIFQLKLDKEKLVYSDQGLARFARNIFN